MSDRPAPDRLGLALVAAGACTPEQIEEAIALRRDKPYFRLGEALVFLGHLTIEQLDDVLARQYRELRLGELLQRRGYLTPKQLALALDFQLEEWRLLGHILVSLGFCSAEQVTEVLDQQQRLSPLDPASLFGDD